MHYSDEQIEYLLSLSGLRRVDVAKAFNEKFGTNKSPDTLAAVAKNHGNFLSSKNYFKEAEIEFLRENRERLTIPLLTKAFNEKFGESRTENSIYEKCKELRLIVGNKNQQNRGWVHWGIGLTKEEFKSHYKSEEDFKRGQFKPGCRSSSYTYQVGDEVNRGDYTFIKITDDITVKPSKQWMAKHRWVWEQANGPVPNGYCIIFIDGNKHNMSLDNLRAVPRAVQGRVRQQQVEPKMIDAVIKIAELECAIHNKRSEL